MTTESSSVIDDNLMLILFPSITAGLSLLLVLIIFPMSLIRNMQQVFTPLREMILHYQSISFFLIQNGLLKETQLYEWIIKFFGFFNLDVDAWIWKNNETEREWYFENNMFLFRSGLLLGAFLCWEVINIPSWIVWIRRMRKEKIDHLDNENDENDKIDHLDNENDKIDHLDNENDKIDHLDNDKIDHLDNDKMANLKAHTDTIVRVVENENIQPSDQLQNQNDQTRESLTNHSITNSVVPITESNVTNGQMDKPDEHIKSMAVIDQEVVAINHQLVDEGVSEPIHDGTNSSILNEKNIMQNQSQNELDQCKQTVDSIQPTSVEDVTKTVDDTMQPTSPDDLPSNETNNDHLKNIHTFNASQAIPEDRKYGALFSNGDQPNNEQSHPNNENAEDEANSVQILQSKHLINIETNNEIRPNMHSDDILKSRSKIMILYDFMRRFLFSFVYLFFLFPSFSSPIQQMIFPVNSQWYLNLVFCLFAAFIFLFLVFKVMIFFGWIYLHRKDYKRDPSNELTVKSCIIQSKTEKFSIVRLLYSLPLIPFKILFIRPSLVLKTELDRLQSFVGFKFTFYDKRELNFVYGGVSRGSRSNLDILYEIDFIFYRIILWSALCCSTHYLKDALPDGEKYQIGTMTAFQLLYICHYFVHSTHYGYQRISGSIFQILTLFTLGGFFYLTFRSKDDEILYWIIMSLQMLAPILLLSLCSVTIGWRLIRILLKKKQTNKDIEMNSLDPMEQSHQRVANHPQPEDDLKDESFEISPIQQRLTIDKIDTSFRNGVDHFRGFSLPGGIDLPDIDVQTTETELSHILGTFSEDAETDTEESFDSILTD